MSEPERHNILKMLDSESEGEYADLGESNDEECDNTIYRSDHDSFSEESEDEQSPVTRASSFVGKNGVTEWTAVKLTKRSRIERCNLLKCLPGPLGNARNVSDILGSWQIFFPDDLLLDIVSFTNTKIRSVQGSFLRQRDARETDLIELKALLGLLYLAGVQKSNHKNIFDLWRADGTGTEYFRLVMGVNRFKFLLRMCRFDNIHERNELKIKDKFSPIRDIFDTFVSNCRKNYSMSEAVTVDEMLPQFRGRCSFRVYMPNKPSKYGIKIFACCDAKTFYTGNMEVYVGKQNQGTDKIDYKPDSVVKRLVQYIYNTGRNVTLDNWFMSYPLALHLLKNGLTTVGTIRKNKGEIPPMFIAKSKDRVVGNSIFGFQKEMTLVSYKPKANKVVLLLSTMHLDDSVDPQTNKPEIAMYYNSTKGGVDVSDRLQSTYSVSRISCRWPLTVFFTLLNIGAINSIVIYKANSGRSVSRREYLNNLVKLLTRDYLLKREKQQNIKLSLRLRVREILGIPERGDDMNCHANGRCAYCPSKKNRKTKTACNTCKKPICLEHCVFNCISCSQNAD
jgi:hypothetical protein